MDNKLTQLSKDSISSGLANVTSLKKLFSSHILTSQKKTTGNEKVFEIVNFRVIITLLEFIQPAVKPSKLGC